MKLYGGALTTEELLCSRVTIQVFFEITSPNRIQLKNKMGDIQNKIGNMCIILCLSATTEITSSNV